MEKPKRRTKFSKPNKQGQVAKDCINFNYCGKHCWIDGDFDTNATDCVVLKGQFCTNYTPALSEIKEKGL